MEWVVLTTLYLVPPVVGALLILLAVLKKVIIGYNMHMVIKKQKPNKVLLFFGLAMFCVWPMLVFLSDIIASHLPYIKRSVQGYAWMEPNVLPVFLTLLVVPPVVGAVLILLAVSKKNSNKK